MAVRCDGLPACGDAAAGRLLVVGTPIGNLGDLSPRAVAAFQAADAVCCEDTRVTGKLLAAAGVAKPLVRCDENVIAHRAAGLVERMRAGEVLAFASDAGMPGVSDPGQVLVDAARAAEVPVEVIPGPVACITALVASGIPCEHFFFEGFLPRRAGERLRRLRELACVPGALLFYESPHRIEAALAAIAEAFPQRDAALCRELTKLHEEVLRAPAPQLMEQVRERVAAGRPLKGEMVVVVAPPAPSELAAWRVALASLSAPSVARADAAQMERPGAAASSDPAAPSAASGAGTLAPSSAVSVPFDAHAALRADIAAALAAGDAPSAIAKRLAPVYGQRRRAVYELVLELQRG